MRFIIPVLAMPGLLALLACGGRQEAEPTPARTIATASMAPTPASSTAKPTATVTGKTYTMYGVLLSRDGANNTVMIDNEEIPGVMTAMKMSYELRGEKAVSAPRDGARVRMLLHEEKGNYWVTDIKPRQ